MLRSANNTYHAILILFQLKRGHDDENTFEPVTHDSSDDGLECTPAAATNGILGSASSPPKSSYDLTPSKWADTKSDPADGNSARATKKHRASTAGHDADVLKSSGFLPTPVITSKPSLVPATPSLNGISPASKGPGDNLLNQILEPAAAAASNTANITAINGAQKEWEQQRKQSDVTAFVGGDNGQSATQNIAAQTALPDEDMDGDL